MKTKLTLIAIALLAIAPLANALTLDQISKTDIFSLTYADGMLSIVSDADIIASGGKEMYWALLVVGDGSLSNLGTSNVVGTGWDVKVESSAVASELGLGNGILGALFNTGAAIPAGTLIWNIATTAQAGTILQFVKLDEYQSEVVATLYEGTFVPEPITVALLGLGGLFVARKKK